MAKTDDKIMALVEKALASNPRAGTTELFEKAKAADSTVGKLTIRQFHARYPLQVKRRKGRAAPKSAAPKSAAPKPRRSAGKASAVPVTGSREGVREVFLRFAQDLADADERRDLIKVLGNLDRYVEDAVRAAQS